MGGPSAASSPSRSNATIPAPVRSPLAVTTTSGAPSPERSATIGACPSITRSVGRACQATESPPSVVSMVTRSASNGSPRTPWSYRSVAPVRATTRSGPARTRRASGRADNSSRSTTASPSQRAIEPFPSTKSSVPSPSGSGTDGGDTDGGGVRRLIRPSVPITTGGWPGGRLDGWTGTGVAVPSASVNPWRSPASPAITQRVLSSPAAPATQVGSVSTGTSSGSAFGMSPRPRTTRFPVERWWVNASLAIGGGTVPAGVAGVGSSAVGVGVDGAVPQPATAVAASTDRRSRRLTRMGDPWLRGRLALPEPAVSTTAR